MYYQDREARLLSEACFSRPYLNEGVWGAQGVGHRGESNENVGITTVIRLK